MIALPFLPDIHVPWRVLVVEDDRCLETVVTRILRRLDPAAEIEWTTSAEDALGRIRRDDFDLVIADVILDGKLTGLDLWKLCRDQKDAPPFLLVSSMPADAFLEKAGADSWLPPFLPKPFSTRECRYRIERALAQRRYSR